MTYDLVLKQIYDRLVQNRYIQCDFIQFRMVTVAPFHSHDEEARRSDVEECISTGLRPLDVGIHVPSSSSLTTESSEAHTPPLDEPWQESLYSPCNMTSHDSCVGSCYFQLAGETKSQAIQRYVWLMNWAAYAVSFPERIAEALRDGSRRMEAATWLQSIASKRQDRANNAIRWAAKCVAMGDVANSRKWLLDSACLQLPRQSDARRSLLKELANVPEEQMIYELIYLARSAPRDIRALACGRLQQFHTNSAVIRTLSQLQWDSSARVRSAASLDHRKWILA